MRQVISSRYSNYKQSERGSENKQNERHIARNRYPHEAQCILQRIEQENSMRQSQTGAGSHSQVTPQTTQVLDGRYLIWIMIIIEEEEIPMPIDKAIIIQTEIGRVIQIQRVNYFNPTYNPLTACSR